MVFGIFLDSFMSSTLGMTKPVLSSRSLAMRSRQANSPAHETDVEQLSCGQPDARLAELICNSGMVEVFRETQEIIALVEATIGLVCKTDLQRQPAAGV